MLKQTLLGLAAATFAFSAFADQAGNSASTLAKFSSNSATPSYVTNYVDTQYYPKKSNTDVYVGIQGGLNIGNLQYRRTQIFSGGLAPSMKTKDMTLQGINGDLFAGIGKYFDDFYLGVEGHAGLSSMQHKESMGAAKLNIKMNYSFGGDLVPGFAINKRVLIYGKVGVVSSHFKVNNNDTSVYFIQPFSKTLIGIEGGLGISVKLVDQIYARAEYDLNYFRNFRGGNFSLPLWSWDNRFRPLTHKFNVGLAIHF